MFAFLWSPTFLVMFGLRGVASPWWVWGFGAFSHTQGLVSAMLTLYKEDIRGAVFFFLRHPCAAITNTEQYDPSNDTILPSGGSSAFWRSSRSGFRTSSRMFRKQQREADNMGLPVQGPDFRFVDEHPMETHVSTGDSSVLPMPGIPEDPEKAERLKEEASTTCVESLRLAARQSTQANPFDDVVEVPDDPIDDVVNLVGCAPAVDADIEKSRKEDIGNQK